MTTLKVKKLSFLINLSILGATGAIPLHANASDAIGPGDSDSKWILGGSLGIYNNPYSGEGTEAVLVPNLTYNGERFFIKDGSLNLHLAKSHGFSGGLTLALDGGFLSDSDEYKNNETLAGLNERDVTVLGGFYLNHDTDLGRLSFTALTDVANEHNGELANLSYTFDLKAGDWNINPVLGVQWMSDDYVDHYVGVSTNEANSSRAAYRGEASFNAFAGVRARYEFTERWDVSLGTGVVKLGSEFSDSSIVEDDLVYQASVGINYNF